MKKRPVAGCTRTGVSPLRPWLTQEMLGKKTIQVTND